MNMLTVHNHLLASVNDHESQSNSPYPNQISEIPVQKTIHKDTSEINTHVVHYLIEQREKETWIRETATINAVPQRSEVNYLWSTLDGNILNVQPLAAPLNPSFGNALLVNPNSTSDVLGIIMGTDSWQITVYKRGTNKLDIKLPNDCPVPSGSITIGLDPNFPFFNGSPTYSNTFLCNTNDGTITDTASVAAKPYTFSLCKDDVPLHPGDIIQNNNYT